MLEPFSSLFVFGATFLAALVGALTAAVLATLILDQIDTSRWSDRNRERVETGLAAGMLLVTTLVLAALVRGTI